MRFDEFKEAVTFDAQPRQAPVVAAGLRDSGRGNATDTDNVKLLLTKSCYQSDICERSPTAEFFKGTTKDCKHIPGTLSAFLL